MTYLLSNRNMISGILWNSLLMFGCVQALDLPGANGLQRPLGNDVVAAVPAISTLGLQNGIGMDLTSNYG